MSAIVACRTDVGALVISLDFELRWGVREKHPRGSPYERQLLATREVIPRILDLFREYDVAATWATVGFLFARSRAELEASVPELRPRYADPRLSPYGEEIGEGERDDPLHYAPGLLDTIRATPRQELATHTFSHYYCNEAGQSAEEFQADLAAARAIAARNGVELRSIVFPRNQRNPAYDAIVREQGITAYRGNPPSRMWAFTDAEASRAGWKRAARLADAYLPLTGSGAVRWEEVLQPSGLADVRASFLLRPYSPALRQGEARRSARLRRALRQAARLRQIVHLWWHPHNFGAHQDENLWMLRSLLEEYRACRDRYAMESLSMAEVAERVGAQAAGAVATVERDSGIAHV